ncbi:MAG: cytochrome c-type biogenesis protein [Gemmatimonadales bacterium]
MESGRRAFLAAGLGLFLNQGLGLPVPGQGDSLAGRGAVGTLRDPGAVGDDRARSPARDNDEFVKGVEHRLRCSCGCNLDIYTCRTTDFSCPVSPRLHREVLALQDEGKSAQEIVDAFVARYGEQILMAPKPEGFNLAGYLVPGVLIFLAGGLLTVRLLRRTRAPADRPPTGPVDGSGAPLGTPEELERLRRALAESEG